MNNAGRTPFWPCIWAWRQSGGSISNGEYQALFTVSKRTASNDLNELASHSLLAVEGAGPSTRYRLAPAETRLPDFLPNDCPISTWREQLDQICASCRVEKLTKADDTVIEQIVALVYASKQGPPTLAGGRIVLANEPLNDIITTLREKSIYSSMVAEHYPILRTIQFMCQYRKDVIEALGGS